MTIGREEIQKLIDECGLNYCFECGKCTAICPMATFFGGIEYGQTPRGIIEKALLDSNLVTGDAIWYCLTCEACTKGCPSGVRIRDFIAGLRSLVMADGNDSFGAKCRSCGGYFLPTITQKQLIKNLYKDSDSVEFIFLCSGCRRRNVSRGMRAAPSSPEC